MRYLTIEVSTVTPSNNLLPRMFEAKVGLNTARGLSEKAALMLLLDKLESEGLLDAEQKPTTSQKD